MSPGSRLRLVLVVAAIALIAVTACGRRTAVLGQQVSGCAAAVAERSAATAAIDLAAEQAVARNGARANELRAIAAEGKAAIGNAADLVSCDDQSRTRGVAVDLAELRARYRVIIDRTAAQLDEKASQPPPAPQEKGNNKGKGGGTKGG